MKLSAAIVLLTLNFLISKSSRIKFTNLVCIEHDKPFVTIPICKLTMVQRGVVAMDLHAKLHQMPVSNITIKNQLFKKANGYRPFLYNITINFCYTMKHLKKYPYIEIYVNILKHYSNINHTCPYDHDIIVKRLVLKEEMFKNIPLPSGNYLIIIEAFAYNDLKATVKSYIDIL